MTARALQVVLLVVASLVPLGCSESGGLKPDDAASNSDGATSDADGTTTDGAADVATCMGPPISCAGGGRSGTGVECLDGRFPGTCVGGQWMCPPDSFVGSQCTCQVFVLPSGLHCNGPALTCTPHGYDCADAGVDADATHDTPDGET